MVFKDTMAWCFSFIRGMKYNTVQMVAIKSPTLSIIFRLCQLGIILYLIIGVIVLKKGYQKFETVTGTTQVKTKGSSYNGGGIPWLNMTTQQPGNTDYTQIFDSTDLIFPPMERDSTFITTNLWLQNNQSRSTCYPGSDDWWTIQADPATADAQCSATCQRGTLVNEAETRTGGVWTGEYTLKPDKKTGKMNCYCLLYTWCPDENIPKNPGPFAFHLMGIENWTVSFRQNVEFKAFDLKTTNLVPKDGTTPPIYSVGDMLDQAGLAYEDIRAKGAVIVMTNEWNCNLDYSVDDCNPKVSFTALGTSFNFRRFEYFTGDGIIGNRQLIKHYGLRMIIILSGEAGQFDFAALFTAVGAGIGLLAVASLVADFAAVNILGKRALYEKAKFKTIIVEKGRIRGMSDSLREAPAEPANTTSTGDVELGRPPAAPIIPVASRPSDAEEGWGKRRADPDLED